MGLAAFAAALGLGACAGEANEEPEAMGTVAAALSKVGPDGATYTFEPGTFLAINAGEWSAQYDLSTGETVFDERLPVGNYTITLIPSDGTLSFVRDSGGTTGYVDAVWTDTQPLAFSISDGQITAIVLHFLVQGLGDVLFEVGDVSVTSDVTLGTVSNFSSAREWGNIFFTEQFYDDPTAPYVGPLYIDISSGLPYPYGLVFAATGDWTPYGPNGVCAPATLATIEPTSIPLQRRFDEVVPGSGDVCVYDNGAADYVQLYVYHQGPAPLDQQSFLPGSNYSFLLVITGTVGDVFDGSTLNQSALVSAMYTQPTEFLHTIDDGSLRIATLRGTIDGGLELSP